MRNTFFSIRKLRETGRAGHDRTAGSTGLASPPNGPTARPQSPARIDYDIPTYIRWGIRLSELPPGN
jgi:hypothetical protein